jgi:hypothetical protein
MTDNLEESRRQDALDVLMSSLEHLGRGELEDHYKLLAISRELGHSIEDVDLIRTCNIYLEEGQRKGLISPEQQRRYEKYARQKVNYRIEVQRRISDCKRFKGSR